MLNEARTEADRIRVDAQAHAEEVRQESNELLEKAKEESDRVLVGLSARRQDMVQHLQDMQDRLLGVAKELEVAIGDPTAEKPEGGAAGEGRRQRATPAPATQAPSQPAPGDAQRQSEDTVDSLEGMLDDGMDLPDLPPLEFDFDDDDDEG